MTNDLKVTPRRVRERRAKMQELAPVLPAGGRVVPGQTQLLFGVDFGTAYSKVVWRDFGGSRIGVAPVGPDGQSMVPSVVWVDGNGGLHLHGPEGARAERFLKMRLASTDSIDGDPDEVAALSVFFLGSILRSSFASAQKVFRGADVAIFGAALGCPAQYCDDGRVDKFQHVAAQAWRWAHDLNAPRTLDALVTWMGNWFSPEANRLFEARPEVAAAVDCFTMRPDAEDGRYVFLDVGAGTLDLACFKLYRELEAKKVTVLATSIAPLGVELVAVEAARETGEDAGELLRELFEAVLFEGAKWKSLRNAVGRFVGNVMVRARGQDRIADWMAAADDKPRIWTSLEDQLQLAKSLPVFFGGGGMTSPFYRDVVRRAGEGLANNYDIPRLDLGELSAPPGFEGVKDAPFHRFAVAYGLTRPFGIPPWKLPSALGEPKAPTPKTTADWLGVEYGSSKDAYD